MSHYFEDLVAAQKRGDTCGLTSICSAHPWVLRAACCIAAPDQPLLIESTCNQVNQFGGYTGMQPADFVQVMHDLAVANDFPADRLILGGDHLGPAVWQHEPAASAMQKACDLIRAYVDAGYVKIHLDASMKLADDPRGPLAIEVAAQRAAQLARAAEEAQANRSGGSAPYYVIGTEVPSPGGAQEYEVNVLKPRGNG
jgi:D-tagatose-1,6-bisphosphate aldolase subunit GatZ/KbaZ